MPDRLLRLSFALGTPAAYMVVVRVDFSVGEPNLLQISLPIRCEMPTTSALPMQNGRRPSVMPMFVHPLGNVCSWSISSGTSLRYRPSLQRTMCLKCDAPRQPSPVRIVHDRFSVRWLNAANGWHMHGVGFLFLSIVLLRPDVKMLLKDDTATTRQGDKSLVWSVPRATHPALIGGRQGCPCQRWPNRGLYKKLLPCTAFEKGCTRQEECRVSMASRARR